MADDSAPIEPDDLPTPEGALRNAVRLLRNAELETNLALMERLEGLADSWLAVSHLIAERERQ